MVVKARYDDDTLKAEERLKLLKQIFAPVKAAQKKHERWDEIDERERMIFVNNVMSQLPGPTSDERALIDAALAHSNECSQWQRLRGSLKMYPTASMFVGEASDLSVNVVEGLWRRRRGPRHRLCVDLVWLLIRTHVYAPTEARQPPP